MWVWGRPPVRALLQQADDAGVGDLFVWVPADLPHSPDLAWVQTLGRESEAAGIRLQALGAETDWIDDPASASAWQRAALSTGLFTGSHLDVEPWLHPGWDDDRARVVGRYLDLLQALADDTSEPVEVDLAFWLWMVQTPEGPLDEAVLGCAESITEHIIFICASAPVA